MEGLWLTLVCGFLWINVIHGTVIHSTIDTWPSVTATVKDARVREGKYWFDYYVSVLSEYEVDGTVYTDERMLGSDYPTVWEAESALPAKGSDIEMLYDPSKPSRSVLLYYKHRDKAAIIDFSCIFIFGLGTLYGIYVLLVVFRFQLALRVQNGINAAFSTIFWPYLFVRDKYIRPVLRSDPLKSDSRWPKTVAIIAIIGLMIVLSVLYIAFGRR
jgi:hypothetical protein